jgi:hypothetical protein
VAARQIEAARHVTTRAALKRITAPGAEYG